MELFKKYASPRNIVFVIIAILFLIFISKIKDIAILFFASYVIACSLNPIVDKLTLKKIPRSMASTIVLLGSLLIILAFAVPIFVMGGAQIASFLNLLPERINNIKLFILTIPVLQNTQINDIDFSGLVSSVGNITSNLVSRSILFSQELLSALIYFLAACIIIYYFMADKEIIKKTYMSLFPKNMKQRAEDITNSISQKIGGYVLAQVITMVSVGLIVFAGLAILKIDYAFLLGVIAALFDIVPIVGPALALVIMLLAVYKLGLVKIGLVFLVFALAQWAENNLVRPYIFSKFLDLHPLIIYFFLFLTAQYLGIIGVVFAPAIAATVCVLIEELYIKSIN